MLFTFCTGTFAIFVFAGLLSRVLMVLVRPRSISAQPKTCICPILSRIFVSACFNQEDLCFMGLPVVTGKVLMNWIYLTFISMVVFSVFVGDSHVFTACSGRSRCGVGVSPKVIVT